MSIFAIVCFIGLRLEWLLQEVDKEEMTIHRVSNHTAINLIDRGKSLLITDSVLWLNTDRKRFHLAPNHLISGVDESLFMPLKVEQPLNVFSWKGLEFLVVSGNLQSWNWEGSTNYDYVILSQNYSGSLDDVLKLVNCKNIVLDGSLKGYVADRLLRESVDTNKTIHSVYHYGAKTIHL